MKGGTTSLHRYLDTHPQIFMSRKKELEFFNGRNWAKGVRWYAGHFEEARDHAAIGETSPGYTDYPMQPDAPERIASVIPEIRLIYLIRDPVARIRSHYLTALVGGYEALPFDDAILRHPRYLNLSLYGMQLERYVRLFPADRILVLRTEDLRSRRQFVMRQVFDFLEVDGDWTSPLFDVESNTTDERRATVGHQVLRTVNRNRTVGEFSWWGTIFQFARRLRRMRRIRQLSSEDVTLSDWAEEYIRIEARRDMERLHGMGLSVQHAPEEAR
jgi:hypothetical protein